MMKAQSYTKREMDMIDAADCPEITEEEFLFLYNKAADREDTEVILRLSDRYPAVLRRVFSPEFEDRHRDVADMEYLCRFPIVIMTERNTPRRVMNLVAYLAGTADAPEGYMDRLRLLPHRLVYNYVTAKYVEDYFGKTLWECFFMGDQRLRHMLEIRSIRNMGELVDRSAAYFEDYAVKNRLCGCRSCEQCQRRWMENYKKSCYELSLQP